MVRTPKRVFERVRNVRDADALCLRFAEREGWEVLYWIDRRLKKETGRAQQRVFEMNQVQRTV